MIGDFDVKWSELGSQRCRDDVYNLRVGLGVRDYKIAESRYLHRRRVSREEYEEQLKLLWTQMHRTVLVTHDVLHHHDVVKLNRVLEGKEYDVTTGTANVPVGFLLSPWNQIPYHLEKSLVTRPLRRGGIWIEGQGRVGRCVVRV